MFENIRDYHDGEETIAYERVVLLDNTTNEERQEAGPVTGRKKKQRD